MDAIERFGPAIRPESVRELVAEARRKFETEDGRHRRDHLRALAHSAEVRDGEIRIGIETELLRTGIAASSVGTAAIDARSFEPKWRAGEDSNLRPQFVRWTPDALRQPPSAN